MGSEPVLCMLVVDDDEGDARLTCEVATAIPSLEVATRCVGTAAAAPAFVSASYDVAVMDVDPDAPAGVDLLRAAARSGVPSIVLSRRRTRELERLAIAAGASDYLVKEGVDAEALERSVRFALERGRLIAEAREATRARDDVLAFVSHDLRNLLTAIQANAQLLMEERFSREVRDQQLRAIDLTAAQMFRLIEDLLRVTQIENRSITLERAAVDAGKLVVAAARAHHPEAELLGVRLDIDPGPPGIVVDADEDRVMQVFSNLIGNALKFTPRRGAVRISAAAEAEHVRFRVTDSGVGIPADEIPRLFDRFWQARHARRAGAGLGLVIAKGLVEAHGGEIGAVSGEGRGSTFWFTLPRLPSGTGLGGSPRGDGA